MEMCVIGCQKGVSGAENKGKEQGERQGALGQSERSNREWSGRIKSGKVIECQIRSDSVSECQIRLDNAGECQIRSDRYG